MPVLALLNVFGILVSLLLIACGLLAAAGLIVKNKPNAAELIGKLVPYQGILGIILLILGLWSLINVLRVMALLPGFALLINLACVFVEIALGFLLGYGLVNKYVLSKSPEAAAKGAQMERKLVNIQAPLGIIAIVLGLLSLITSIL